MSAPIDTSNNNINTNTNQLAKQSKGGVEHVSPEDTASTGPSTSVSPGNPVIEDAPVDPVPQLDNMRELSDADQVLESDQVRAALQGGRSLSITRLRLLADRTTLEAWPDPCISYRGGPGVSCHMTVPRRYQDLCILRDDFHLHGKFGEAFL